MKCCWRTDDDGGGGIRTMRGEGERVDGDATARSSPHDDVDVFSSVMMMMMMVRMLLMKLMMFL